MRVNREKLSKELSSYLNSEGMSFEAFAQKSGVALSTVSRVIAMHHDPSLETVTAIAKYLRIDPVDFLDFGGAEYLNMTKLPRQKYDAIKRIVSDQANLSIA